MMSEFTPTIKLPKECIGCIGGIGTVNTILAANLELANAVGNTQIEITSTEHDTEFPQSCTLTAIAGRNIIFENLEVACVRARTKHIPTPQEIRRKRDAWSMNHQGMTHPDDKIQGV